ncbi:MAG: tRNA (adenosine(37)-N6)-threonylcarbamoyltransferase complex ATPase subunit type 1 TsaE [Gemmatimonadota bacterium]|uniref:tRNA (adenosine(37)-N6)-threonylcarbamoyltransferase complex ATPase subunit type 1 TsaE n=1 Tax=Candidatus Palauibacter scopulicola TaxID=3056741 RepID=UPI002384697B|nr:tRNA (adenosine(37)-N6)-threonylcarbamoyltransferase complex ATPase subunit type 1 TsaE [Candidatus Palauibacter scopulicola]MDE2663250.1 tRNA (adenosine(37)-N6)-threonylcarbamoyltransferase complex ATPase subunit type 1 TsaE [Candidatus Palauibacter scopulicola]
MRSAVLDEAGLVRWGREVGAVADREEVFVALTGPLGAGKTRFTQAACAGAGVDEAVTSPTYTLVHWYAGVRGPVGHADLYRLRDPSELLALGWEEIEAHAGAVFVEWAERAGEELPRDRWEVRFEFSGAADNAAEAAGRTGGSLRRVTARALGRVPPVPDPGLYAEGAESSAC